MVSFFNEDVKFNLKNKRVIKSWIKDVAILEQKKILTINYIFCSDNYLLGLNIKYLDHNYLTDILTFSSTDNDKHLEGDIFISIERVLENSLTLNYLFEAELARVLVHGLLHLIGYDDTTTISKAIMTQKEDYYLQKLERALSVSRETS